MSTPPLSLEEGLIENHLFPLQVYSEDNFPHDPYLLKIWNACEKDRDDPTLQQDLEVKVTKKSKELGLSSLFSRHFRSASLIKSVPSNPSSVIHDAYQKHFSHLQKLCQSKLTAENNQIVLKFVEAVIFEHEKNPKTLTNLSEKIGQLIFLLDIDLQETLKCLDKTNLQKSLKKLDAKFSQVLADTQKNLDELYQAHLKTGLQNPDIARQIALPIEISRFLVTSLGSINSALIFRMIQEFIPETLPNRNYVASLRSGLHLLAHSDILRNHLESLAIPPDNHFKAHDLIRLSLKIPPQTKLTDQHAKQCMLAALLTHLRQGNSGSCFASFIAIEQQSMDLEHTCDDLTHLLKEGQLLRQVDQKSQSFPSLMCWGCEEYHRKILINAEGLLLNSPSKNAFLWEAPCFKTIVDQLGLPSPKEAIVTWLKSKKFPEEGLEITLETLINELGCKKTQEEIKNALFGVAALINQPLLRMWENSLAAMSEGRKGSILNSALSKSIEFLMRKSAKKKSVLIQFNASDIIQVIEKIIDERIHYLYDPTILLNHAKASDSHSTQGAFVLYDSINKADHTEWKRIDTCEKFKEFLSHLMDDILDKVNQKDLSELKEQIAEDLNLEKTMCSLLKAYHEENIIATSTQEGISSKHIRYTPWMTVVGNDPKMVMRVYQNEISFQAHSFIPESPTDLIYKITNLVRNLPQEKKENYLSKENSLTPCRIYGLHAFSLLMKHPSIMPYYYGQVDFKNYLENPDLKKFSSLEMTSLMKKAVIDYVCEKVEKNQRAELRAKLQELPQKIAIKEFRQLVHKTLNTFTLSSKTIQVVMHQIDVKIVESLPKPLREAWQNSIIHFADTNWQLGINDIHYGIGLNPGTGEIELMCVLDDGRVYEFLNQHQYLKAKTWEINLVG